MPWKVRTKHEMDLLIEGIQERGYGYVYDWEEIGTPRSTQSNSLAWVWYGEIARHLGDRTADEIHRECKLFIGVPILRSGSSKACQHFREQYDRLFKNRFTLEEKLALMDYLPVTRLMTKTQMKEYLETMQLKYSEQGIILNSLCEIDYQDCA